MDPSEKLLNDLFRTNKIRTLQNRSIDLEKNDNFLT